LALLGLALPLACQDLVAQVAIAPDKDSAEWQVYTNEALFNQLSGAARTRAELHFGKKPRSKADSDGPESSGWIYQAGDVTPNELIRVPLVNNPAEDTTSQDTQSETSLAVAGTNIVCGFNDSSQYGISGNKFTGWSSSPDRGSNWVDGLTLPTNPDGDAGDPTLAYSAKTGTLLYGTLSFTPQDLVIFRSVDNGVTFTAPVLGSPGYTSSTGSQDKDWLTCDNFVGPPGSGYGNFYYFWRNFAAGGGMTLTRSLDDGMTFVPAPGLLITSGTGQGGNVIVGPDHSVYCFWFDSSVVPNRIVVRKSTDQGQTFGPIVVVTTLVTSGVNGDLALGGYRSNAFPQLAVNPVTGAIYIVYPDLSGADHGNIYFRQSTDGGNSWSAPVTLNDDGTTRAQFQPGIACRPDGTGLAVSWYDRRSDVSDALIERWATTATVSPLNVVTFNPNFRLSPQFPAVYGVDSVVNSVYMGDYDQMAADNNYFYTSWGDNRDQSTAVPARKNANIRFARFGMNDRFLAQSLTLVSATVVGGNGNGMIDMDECNNINVVIRNDGGATATNVNVSLTTSAPGVTLAQATASYPDLAPGATGTNLTSFKISTSPCFACGTPININALFSYVGGADPGSFNLPVFSAGYSMTSTTGASIVPGVTDIGNHIDDGTTTIALPFSYSFYGTLYTSAALCSNGNIQFNTVNTAYSNGCLPASGFTDAIYPHWDDLRTDAAGSGIFTSTTGVAPNRIFNIEWRATYYSGAGSLNFEARLYEGQQRLDLIYGILNGTGASATVGVQHGNTFTSYECNGVGGALSLGQQLTFQATTCSSGGGQCPAAAPTIPAPSISGGNFTFSFATDSCRTYNVQYKNNINDATWLLAQSFAGDGTTKVFSTPVSSAYQFYRLQVQ
jgi:hypothetical protein